MDVNINKCNMCPHECKVNRNENKIGKCRAGKTIKIAKAGMHYYWEIRL